MNTPQPPHRAGHEMPPTTGPDRYVRTPRFFIPSAAPIEPSNRGNEAFVDILAATNRDKQEAQVVDQGLNAVKDLQKEE
jgi:hypothetical protein